MSQLYPIQQKTSFERGLFWVLVLIAIVLNFVREPIYSFDTYSYLRADVTRFPGYILFIRTFEAVFGEFYDRFIVGFQLALGMFSVWLVHRNCSRLFSLGLLNRTILLLLLVFPFFPPLDVALNLSSEGISYPFYLLAINSVLVFLFGTGKRQGVWFVIFFLALCLTRGQFVVMAPVVALVYFLKERKRFSWSRTTPFLLLILALPLIVQFLDSSYRKVFYGHFHTTPYSYVNAITLPLFVSKASDANVLEDPDVETIFLHSYQHIDSLGLLSSKVEGGLSEKYQLFHNNFPKICNQNIHEFGLHYYLDKGLPPPTHAFAIESSCKALFPILIERNFTEWLQLVFAGIFYGFGSFVLFLVVVVLAVWGLIRSWHQFSLKSGFILLGTLLLLSNALVVAVASHSISRYLFYNYFLGALILMILLKKNTAKNER